MNKKTNILEEVKETTVVDQDGNIVSQKTTKTKKMAKRSTEPDYIKLYTNMWCEFNQIPQCARALFFEMAIRMTYCNSDELENSQLVFTAGPNQKAMMVGAGITNEKVFYRHLKMLADCNAIKKVSRGCYQINPQYAGRGSWHYNAKEKQGGIEDLVAVFNFKKGTVETQMTWAAGDDYFDAEELGLKEGEQIVARKTVIKNDKDIIPNLEVL